MTYEQYPGVSGREGGGTVGGGRFTVCVIDHGQTTSMEFLPSSGGAVTEDQALAIIQGIVERRRTHFSDLRDNDVVLKVSDRELIIHRTGFFTATRTFRIVVGQVT